MRLTGAGLRRWRMWLIGWRPWTPTTSCCLRVTAPTSRTMRGLPTEKTPASSWLSRSTTRTTLPAGVVRAQSGSFPTNHPVIHEKLGSRIWKSCANIATGALPCQHALKLQQQTEPLLGLRTLPSWYRSVILLAENLVQREVQHGCACPLMRLRV